MKRILITGGTGFFGKSILDYFSRHGGDCEITKRNKLWYNNAKNHALQNIDYR